MFSYKLVVGDGDGSFSGGGCMLATIRTEAITFS